MAGVKAQAEDQTAKDQNHRHLTACNFCCKEIDATLETQLNFTPDSPVAKLLSLKHLECTKLMIQQRPETKKCLILGAAAFGYVDCLQILLADTNLETLIGKEKLAIQAVHMAARRGQCQALELLLDLGIHPDVRLESGPPGLTATYLAAANGHPRCLKLLIEAGGRGSLVPGISPLYGAVINEHMNCALVLLKHQVWGQDQAGELIRRLASEGNLTYLEALINKLSHIGLLELHKAPVARSIKITKLKDDIQVAAREAAQAGRANCLKVLMYSAFSDIYSVSSVQDLIYDSTRNGYIDCLATIFESAVTVNVDQSFVVAAKKGHLQCLQILSDYNAALSLTARDQAILEASTNGHIHCLAFLLQNSTQYLPDVLCPSVLNQALVRTSSNGHADCLKLLFSNNYTDLMSVSTDAIEQAVQASAEAGHTYCLSMIYQKLRDRISFEAHYGAIERAAVLGRSESLRLILRSMPKFTSQCSCMGASRLLQTFGKTAVHGHYDCAVILENESTYNTLRDSIFLSRHLVTAAALGNLQGLTTILKLGEDPNRSAIKCYFGREYLVEWWLENVCEVYKSTQYETSLMNPSEFCSGSETPLLVAVQSGMADCAKALLAWGANPNIVNKNGETSLICAARRGDHALVKLLLQHGASPDLCHGSNQTTALEYAADFKHAECVKLLLQYNARVDLAFRFGQTYNHQIRRVFDTAGCFALAKVPGYRDWFPYAKSDHLLQYFCRSSIRRQLVQQNPRSNLFYMVPKLPLPLNLQQFVLNCS